MRIEEFQKEMKNTLYRTVKKSPRLNEIQDIILNPFHPMNPYMRSEK